MVKNWGFWHLGTCRLGILGQSIEDLCRSVVDEEWWMQGSKPSKPCLQLCIGTCVTNCLARKNVHGNDMTMMYSAMAAMVQWHALLIWKVNKPDSFLKVMNVWFVESEISTIQELTLVNPAFWSQYQYLPSLMGFATFSFAAASDEIAAVSSRFANMAPWKLVPDLGREHVACT